MPQTISAGKTPKIEIESVGGDLSVVGWEGEDILVKGDEEGLHTRQDGDRLFVSCDDDLLLRVPRGASLSLQTVEGDMTLKNVTGGIALREVHGDLSVRDINSIAIETVHADFSLRGAKGSLSLKSVLGDASIREVDGSVAIESITDDLALRDVRGNVSANVGEDVILYLTPQPGNAYNVTAGDDILLVMPPNADATLTLNGDMIEVDWKGIPAREDTTQRVITLGNGSALVTLTAGGDIRVTSQLDAGESADEFGNFAGIGFDWSGFDDRISRQVERAAKRAEEAARRVERNINRRVKANVKVGRWNWDIAPGRFSPAPSTSASDEERMAILKMLAEKKITSEEADKLLSALEGGE